jgi:hypothetical protein
MPNEYDPEERRAALEGMVALGGQFAEIASELLVAMDEREAKAARESEALAAIEGVGPDDIGLLLAEFDRVRLDPDADPADALALQQRVSDVKDGLRAQVLNDYDATNRRVLSETEALLRMPDKYGSTRGEEEIAAEIADLRASMDATKVAMAGSDPLEDSPIWQAYQWQSFTAARERQAVQDIVLSRPDYMSKVAEEAGAANDAYIDRLAGIPNE